MDAGRDILWWVAIGLGTAPAWWALIWVVWNGTIRPRLIPATEIDAMASTLVAQWGDNAVEIASIEEDRARRYSDSFAQGRWRRVRLSIKLLAASHD